jgi:hypothetical protein
MRLPLPILLLPSLASAAAGRVAELPVIDGLLALPSVASNIERIARATDDLPEIRRDMARVADATALLPDVLGQLQQVAQATSVLPEMEEHVRDIEQMVPLLVELERSLPALTPAIAVLTESMERMLAALDHLDGTVNTLVAVAQPLQGPAERLGRIADRFPRRSRARDGRD